MSERFKFCDQMLFDNSCDVWIDDGNGDEVLRILNAHDRERGGDEGVVGDVL